eukprot:TRINITY_DN15930_c0_g1_i1.p1 TRINITY_DN15930_c0_g1~~TRINITY_DN15930_c0_g1_i1.p1  ORF type:complete len:348 (+),score=44.71 TRINITY_DN15930_c0_g1_i1:83-1126(+)
MGQSPSKSEPTPTTEVQKNQDEPDEKTRIVLLGSLNAGKTTFYRQVSLAYSPQALEVGTFRSAIQSQALRNLQSLIRSTRELVKLPQHATPIALSNETLAQALLDHPENSPITPDIFNAMKCVWADSGIQKTYSMRHQCPDIAEIAHYFLDKVDEISAADYVPSIEDVLKCKTRTIGICSQPIEFKTNENATRRFELYDVGGSRDERKKWVLCFDNVAAFVCVVSLSGYDRISLYEPITEMQESLNYFDSLVSHPNCRQAPSFFLLFTKSDLLAEKLATSDLSVHFPDYNGGNQLEHAIAFIRRKFEERVPEGRTVHSHVVSTLNHDNIRQVFDQMIRIITSETHPA